MTKTILIKRVSVALMVLITLSCIFTPNIMVFRLLSRYSVQIMLAFLALGLLLLALQQQTLMFASLGCCAALCIFLKSSAGIDFRRDSPTSAPAIKVTHINLSAITEDYNLIFTALRNNEADIVSLQEMTPDWNRLISDSLRQWYPYQARHIGFSMDGLAIFSRFPIVSKDTFYCGETPILSAIAEIDSTHRVAIISSYLSPPLYSGAYKHLKEQLDTMNNYINRQIYPTIIAGDFNLVVWSDEISKFRHTSHLANSRLNFVPNYQNGHLRLFDVPIDHIFFSRGLRCLDFETIGNPTIPHIGISGLYQFRSMNNTTETAK